MRKRVAIIGGGFLGVTVASLLEKDFSVVLIDQKDYFEYTPSILRILVDKKLKEKLQRPHKLRLKQSEIVVGNVLKIKDDEVVLTDTTVPFDYLVIASGTEQHIPIKDVELFQVTKGKDLLNYDVSSLKDIVIIGGGLVGVELASEIVDHYKGKEVTLVEFLPTVMARNNKKVQQYCYQWLEKKGVQVEVSTQIVGQDGSVLLTKDGKKIQSDMTFVCAGIKANSSFLQNPMRNILNERNAVKVNSFLQVVGHPHIFSGGDVSAILEEKTAQSAEFAGKIIAENIKRKEKGERLIRYIPKKRWMLVNLGKWDGVMTYGNFTLTGFIPSVLKRFVEWKTLRKY